MRTTAAARQLAEFAASLCASDIPALDWARAKDCLIDSIGVSMLGATLPWGRIVASYAKRYGGTGKCSLIGSEQRVAAPLAALANGVFAHGFEFDSVRKPGAGVHPGAALVPAALAVGQESHSDGRTLLTALVAGCEVMFRIGLASKHSSESLGFHAPGLTGPFGAAVTAGRILGLDATRMTNALGIAGSLCGGVLAFTKSGNGAMVKRLHLGRAAEAGILAARLAQDDYEGPDSILEGQFGFLDTYCKDVDPSRLTRDLGTTFETRTLCIKRYPCHITAQTPIHAIESIRADESFTEHDIAQITVWAGSKVLSHHANREPADMMEGQYSVPFCVAVALVDDPLDVTAFGARNLSNSAIRLLCKKIALEPFPSSMSARSSWASDVRIRLKDGREFRRSAEDFKGSPDLPLSTAELREKFMRCAQTSPNAPKLFVQLGEIESMGNVGRLSLA